ncbi:hypothetical protein IGI04_019473 [Brassica rapa subsp. trilocularis]|uniref:Uncharacterized protein n=1 Tax=Brassica rapa subsp. trilocularis TaxID=1813537 RepID=A0ABQ7MFY7_BRACM|nr:hypothetical protein IGI04_019473 [Brassica rapa subsp. trilocularis]
MTGKLAYAGYLYLNSTPASKFYFDRNIPAIEEFTSRNIPAIEEFTSSSRGIPCIDTMEGIKKKELVSIGDLNTFISNSSVQRKPISYVKLWSLGYSNKMVGHTGCSMKLDKSGTSLRCKCVSTNITGVIRDMSKHTEQEADTLALDEISGGEGQELPRCLEELAGKDYVFQIRVSSCTSNPTAVVDGEDGQLTASASNTVEGAKIAMGVDCRERKQPHNAPQTTSHAEDRDFDFI